MTTINPLTGDKFYVLIGNGGAPEAFSYLCVGTSVDSDLNLDVEDAMVGDPTDPAIPSVRQSSVKGRTWDMTLSGLADPDKIARLKTLNVLGLPGNFRLTRSAAGGYLEDGAFLVTSLKEAMSDRGLVKFTATLHGQGAPTVSGLIDTTPDAFSFTGVSAATRATAYTSSAITVAGLAAPAAISIAGGTYSINGGAFTSASGTVVNGDQVTVRQTSSASYSTATSATLTIGGVSAAYVVTTLADPAGAVPTMNFTLPKNSGYLAVLGA